MNINRHNYETFFLLYVDNELSAADRKAVEEFVQVNTDLQVELQLLLETTLPTETVSYNATQDLYKKEIELDSLQESLLLHLDNELDASAKKEIEAAIGSDNNINKEWQVWQQTKLDSKDVVEFKDKKSLYRHEGSRVVAMRFWRIAAAAAILLMILLTGISILRNNKPLDKEDSTAKNETKAVEKKQSVNKDDIKIADDIVDPSEKTSIENIASANATKEKEQKENNTNPVIPVKQQGQVVEKNNIAVEKNINNKKEVIEKTSLENINKEKSNEIIASTVLTNRKSEVVPESKIPDAVANTSSIKEKISAPSKPFIDYNSVPAMPDSYAKTAGLNEGTSENNNKIFYMNEETVTRSKVGGLFRKVKRIVERNANIKTGKSVKIAGFEIALK